MEVRGKRVRKAFDALIGVLRSGFCSYSLKGISFMINGVVFDGDEVRGCVEAYRRVSSGVIPREFILDIADKDMLFRVYLCRDVVRFSEGSVDGVGLRRARVVRRFLSVLSSGRFPRLL